MSDNNHNNANANISSLQGLGHRSHFDNHDQTTQGNLNSPSANTNARFSSPATVHSWRTASTSHASNPQSRKFDFQSQQQQRQSKFNRHGRSGQGSRRNRYQAQTMRHSHSHIHHAPPQASRMKSYHHGQMRGDNRRSSRYHKQNAQQKKQEMLKQEKKMEQFMSEMHHIFHENHFDNKDGVRRTILWQLFEQEKEKESQKEGPSKQKGQSDEHEDVEAMDITVSQFRTLLQQAKHLGLLNIEFRKIDPNDEKCTKQVFIHLCENGFGVPEIVNKLEQQSNARSNEVRAQTARSHNGHTGGQPVFNYNGVTPQLQPQSNGVMHAQTVTNQSLQLALATQQMQLQMQYQGMQPELQQLNSLPQNIQNLQLLQLSGQLPQQQLQQPTQSMEHQQTRPSQAQRRRSSQFAAKTIKCSFCGKMFYNERGLKQHSLQRHAKALGFEYTCKYCNYHFPSDIEYNQHLNEVHGNEMLVGSGMGHIVHVAGGVNNDVPVLAGAQFGAMDLYSPVA